MQRVVIDEPYVPVLPKRGRFWPAVLKLCVPHLLRKGYGVTRVECQHVDRLQASIAAGHGILLAPNHCRDEDPVVLGMLARAARTNLFIMASWHVFKQNRLNAFLLPRAGAFSIYREGIDRAAVNTSIAMLEHAERPLVMFPEGFISRTNDRLTDLMEGVSLITRTAAKKRAKLNPPGKVVVHPVALRYRLGGDVGPALTKVMTDLEAQITWPAQAHLPLLDRIYKLGEALLTLKELQYLGAPRSGPLRERIARLTDVVLTPLENEWAGGRHDDNVNARVKRLRMAILPDLVQGGLPEAERTRRWRHLADAYFAQQLFHYPPDYLGADCPPERLLETVERLEEDLTDKVRIHGQITATITVGEAIEVSPGREGRGAEDPLLVAITRQLRAMLGLANPGPPP